ncbi:MAG: ArsR family transcriptional regulator [Roseibium sp.]
MAKTTVLFVCADNSLLGQMAEAYLNARLGNFMRAFSAGLSPAEKINPSVDRLLRPLGIGTQGLQPKPVDVFLMPHSVIPDRIIYLSEMKPVSQPSIWKRTTSSHWWSIAPQPPFAEDLSACDLYLKRIRSCIDSLVDRSSSIQPATDQNAA